MAIALDPNKPWRYVLEADRKLPEQERTVWLLKPLTMREYSRLQDSIAAVDQASGTLRVTSGTQTAEALRLGLIGCDNLRDGAGIEVAFQSKYEKRQEREIVTDAFLDRLHPDWRAELAKAITEHNTLTEADLKNC